jgi:glycosyltransferase involved in cell wall biosynthesis
MLHTQAPVTVVIPCYCCANTIEYAVNSIDQQTLKPYEVILVEDHSSDNTLRTLHRLQNHYQTLRIKVIELPKNSGPSTARNIGWKAATQLYIAFLDADDSWHPQKIEIQYNWMKKHPNVALTGHKCKVINRQDGLKYPLLDHIKNPKLVKDCHLLLSNRFKTPSVMLRSDIDRRFDKTKKYSEDFLLWMQICLKKNNCYYFNSNLAFLHKHAFGEDGLSAQLWNIEKGELQNYRTIYKESLINIFQFMFFSMFSFVKFLRRYIVVQLRSN